MGVRVFSLQRVICFTISITVSLRIAYCHFLHIIYVGGGSVWVNTTSALSALSALSADN